MTREILQGSEHITEILSVLQNLVFQLPKIA